MTPGPSRRFLPALLAILLLTGCRGADSEEHSSGSSPASRAAAVSLNKEDYPVFPDADAGADPSVPAEQGGKGFKGEGWETSTGFDLIGDPRAVKGGTLRDHMTSFPGTLRMAGPEWNTEDNYTISNLVYEQLTTLHSTTLEYIPALATHWKIDPDKVTYRFRLDPNARFSDGTPVTSDDVVATWKFLTDRGLDDLYYYEQFNKLELPVAESKYIVRIKAKKAVWDSFLTAATMRIMPASALKNIDGKAYLKDYNFKLLPGTGPYILNEADVEKGKSVTLRRRKDYWAEKYRINIGQNNVDEFKRVVVRDENLAIELLKKGELDFYYVRGNPRAWMEQFKSESFERGLELKKAVFNNYPADQAYIAFNMRRKPFDDIQVRKALTLLFNRAQIIEKLFYGLYLPTNSYYPATIYENPNNPKNTYSPEQALQLLKDAGWTSQDSQGRLLKNGQPFQIEVLYSRQYDEPWLTVFQEDLRKVGITLNLRLLTPETRFKLLMQRQFEMAVGVWGVGSPFPNPRPESHSEAADRDNTNNITGLKDKRVDQLIESYDVEFDAARRTGILRELDLVMTETYQYIHRWYDPAIRLGSTNKFGIPQGTLSRMGDHLGSFLPGIPQLWWIDPDKQAKWNEAMRNTSMKLEAGPVDDKYWLEFARKQSSQIPSQGGSK